MKKKYLLLTLLLVVSLTACGKGTNNSKVASDNGSDKAVVSEETSDDAKEEEVTPDYRNFIEEQAEGKDFEDLDDVVSALNPGQGYAFVDIKDVEHPVLLVSPDVFMGSDGTKNSIYVEAYTSIDGCVKSICTLSSGSDGNPIKISDGLLYVRGDNFAASCGWNDLFGAMVYKDYAEKIDDVYSGYSHTTSGNQIAMDDKSFFDELAAAYDRAKALNFEVVK